MQNEKCQGISLEHSLPARKAICIFLLKASIVIQDRNLTL